jgi:hypothetical protein
MYNIRVHVYSYIYIVKYSGADKSLARPRRKQAIATEDFEFHVPYL